MSNNVRPLGDRVLVEPAAAETTTLSGIIIPETAKEKPQRGTVIAVGIGKYAEKTGVFIPTTLTVGTKVLFHPYAGSEMTVGGETFYNMPEGDVWAIIEDDD
jgi:chaperonin GroES